MTITYAYLEPDSSGQHITEPLEVRCIRWGQDSDQIYEEGWFEPHEIPSDEGWVIGDVN